MGCWLAPNRRARSAGTHPRDHATATSDIPGSLSSTCTGCCSLFLQSLASRFARVLVSRRSRGCVGCRCLRWGGSRSVDRASGARAVHLSPAIQLESLPRPMGSEIRGGLACHVGNAHLQRSCLAAGCRGYWRVACVGATDCAAAAILLVSEVFVSDVVAAVGVGVSGVWVCAR